MTPNKVFYKLKIEAAITDNVTSVSGH